MGLLYANRYALCIAEYYVLVRMLGIYLNNYCVSQIFMLWYKIITFKYSFMHAKKYEYLRLNVFNKLNLDNLIRFGIIIIFL